MSSFKEKEEKNIINSSDTLFNSKLFLDLDINDKDIYLNSYTENSSENIDNLPELDEINFLSNELIKDLDLLTVENKKNIINNDIIIDSLLSLAKDGYEFMPKNYKPNQNNNPNNFFNIRNNSTWHNKIREKKNDWFCSYCNNLNFSFRNKCNKCKISKENSIKYKRNYKIRIS